MDVKNNNKTMKGGFRPRAHDSEKKTMVTGGPTRPILSPKPTLVSGGAKTKKAKKSKKPMPKDSAYCLRCQKATKMLTKKERTTKNGRKQVVGKGECGHEVFRFI